MVDAALDDIVVVGRDGPVSVGLQPVDHAQEGADIAVFVLDREITPNLTLHATSGHAVFSQDVYFLGFPYGLGLTTGEITYPFVKKGILAAADMNVDGVRMWFVDGINNPGFSGGPVVFNRSGTKEWHVAAVVSGYRTEHVAIMGAEGHVPMNTGIIVAYDIAHATDAIDAYSAQQGEAERP